MTKRRKKTDNDLQNSTQNTTEKTKDRATRNPLILDSLMKWNTDKSD